MLSHFSKRRKQKRMTVKRAEERGRNEEEKKHQFYGTACMHNRSLILILKLVGCPALKLAQYFCTSIFSKGTYFGAQDCGKKSGSVIFKGSL